VTGIERMITVTTDEQLRTLFQEDSELHIGDLLRTEARLLELTLRDGRSQSRLAPPMRSFARGSTSAGTPEA
jgi:hypothetical protein